jgi:hypothetical protein
MQKYENHIYLIICEITMNLYKETGFSTHSYYCLHMKACIKDGVFTQKQAKHICKISDVLEMVFYIDAKKAGIYISDFFNLEKYKNFEKVVLYQKKFFSEFIDDF